MENEYLEIFLISMLPITELRLSVPIGVACYDLNWLFVCLAAVLGNFLVCIPIVYLFSYFEPILKRNKYANLILEKVFSRTRSKSRIINKYKYYGIILFVGLPLPFTGAWTGSLASYLFGFKRKKALAAIFLGLIISAAIVTVVSIFLDHLLIYIGHEICEAG